jgi:signal transduction histidine kinase
MSSAYIGLAKRLGRMQKHDKVDAEQQSLLLAASVHQARQPLYVLQNTLFAANFLVQRLEASPDAKLIQQALVEMRSSVDRLTSTISVIAGIAKPESRKLVETLPSDLVKEAFQMASFCLRNEQGMVNYELPPTASTPAPPKVLMDYPNVLIALIQWIFAAASNREFQGETDHPESLTLSASTDDGNMTIHVRNSRHTQQIRLDQIISSVTNPSGSQD